MLFTAAAISAAKRWRQRRTKPRFLRFNAGIRAATDDGKCEAGLIGRNLSNNYYLLTAQDKTNQAGDMRGTVARGRQIMLQAGFKFLTRKH